MVAPVQRPEIARIVSARPKISVRGVGMTFPAKDRSAQDVHVL